MGRPRHTAISITVDQEAELVIGPDFAVLTAGLEDRDSTFASDEHRRAAWKQHADRLVRESIARAPGNRPWAWWRYVAGRGGHVLPHPPDPYSSGDKEDCARQLDEYDVDPIRFLAENGHLTPAERAALVAAGREARERIDTDRQRGTRIGGVWIGPDRTAATIAEAIEGGER